MAIKTIRVFAEYTSDGYVPMPSQGNIDYGVTVGSTFPETQPSSFQTDDPNIDVAVTTMTDYYVWIRTHGSSWNPSYTRVVRIYPDSPSINSVVMNMIVAVGSGGTSIGGGSGVSYYLNGGTSQGILDGSTYYEMSKVPVEGTGVNFFKINTTGFENVAQFVTDAGDPGLLNIPAGNWPLGFYFSASDNSGNPSFYAEIYKYTAAGVFTLLASNSGNPEIITNGQAVDFYIANVAIPDTTLLVTDRIAVRIFVDTDGNRTVTLHTQDSTLSTVGTTFTRGITAINGLIKQVQYFAIGNAGSDAAIVSSDDTHTINLPTASATKRGLLNGTDWSTFNAKQPALSGDGFVKISGSTISYDNNTYLTPLDAASVYQRLDKMVSNLLPSNTEYPNSNAVLDKLALKANIENPSFTGSMNIVGIESRINFYDEANAIKYFIGYDSGFLRIFQNAGSASRFYINSDGKTFIPGILEVGSVIKSGGTASQFLKADGSVDGTTYATSSSLSSYLLSSVAATTYQRIDKMVSNLLASDTEYPNSNAVLAKLALKADAANPNFTGSMNITGIESRINFYDENNARKYFIGYDGGTLRIYQDAGSTSRYYINPSGKTFIPGDLEVGAISKSGGTATQFLKADGSVDSSTYVTSTSLSSYLLSSTAASTYQRLDKMVSNLLASDTEYPNSNAVLAALALKANAANPTFTGDFTINGATPRLYFVDTDNNPDYTLFTDSGYFYIYNQTAGSTKFSINPDGNTVIGGSLLGSTASFSGNITVSSGNTTGGGIILADDGDIVDLNDAYCSMRFSYGVRVFSASRGGTPVITLANTGAITATGNITGANLSGTNTGDQINISGNAATATNVAWTGVTGRPTALSSFTNDSGYITSDSTKLPLSGGTLTGNLLFADSGTGKRGIQGTVGTNDMWFVGGGATASNSGYLEISTGDDAQQTGVGEPIYVRQYGPGDPLTGTLFRSATLLDASGNTYFPGTIQGGNYIWATKVGGTNNTPGFQVRGSGGGPRIQTYGLDADSNAWMGIGTDMAGNPYEHSLYFPYGAGSYANSGRQTIGSYDGTTYSPKATFLSNGRIGFGIVSPEAALHVAQSGQDDQLILGSSANNRDHAMFMYSGPNKAEVMRYQSGSRFMLGGSGNISKTSIFGGGSERLTVESGGVTAYRIYSTAGGGYNLIGGSAFVLGGSGATFDNSTGVRLTESYGPVWNCANGSTWHHQVINGSSLVGISAAGTNFGNGNIWASGDITAYYSDMRLKTKISNIENALEKVLSLNGFYYINNEIAKNYGYNDDKVQIGVSAQEVEAILPEIVTLAPFDVTGNENGDMLSKSGNNFKTVKYDKLVPLLIEAIKEQQFQIKHQLSEIKEIKKIVNNLLYK